MPRHRKRRFIDPRKSVTFEVVPRNQVDPLVVDETAPKNVLVEKRTKRIIDTDSHEPRKPADEEKRLEEQHKYGIYFDDDYNYLQHLRDVHVLGTMEKIVRVNKDGIQMRISEGKKSGDDVDEKEHVELSPRKSQILLPSSVFASHVEERVGHLHKGLTHAGPQPDWDPDIMAALDDDAVGSVEAEDALEDDFVALASGGANLIEDLGAGDTELSTRRFYFVEGKGETTSPDDEDEFFLSSDTENYGEDESSSETANNDDMRINKIHRNSLLARSALEETRSRFTNYSLSSSVMTRTGGLKSLDEQFEDMFDKEYNECDIGALDGEAIEGRLPLGSSTLSRLADRYQNEVRLNRKEVDDSLGGIQDDLRTRVLRSLDRTETTEELRCLDKDPDLAEQSWDCESILSTYSNILNRPTVIELGRKTSAVQLSSRGLPVENDGLSRKNLRQLDGGYPLKSEDYAKSVCSRASLVSAKRPKDESSIDRKTRKNQVKDFRRERRAEKKQSKQAFREEESRQRIQEMNVRSGLQGLKLY
ncbi:protein LTV1 homolog [Galendromus occidentalis]|uniref:Protein LTV1 homolog n=1 Tax=Galendromus occidentalis TaxID=34638 RepID=A0AAJ6VV44_9ACAR|nr:protein LTV1 homolog [Galendromus occidentalis]